MTHSKKQRSKNLGSLEECCELKKQESKVFRRALWGSISKSTEKNLDPHDPQLGMKKKES